MHIFVQICETDSHLNLDTKLLHHPGKRLTDESRMFGSQSHEGAPAHPFPPVPPPAARREVSPILPAQPQNARHA